jgi:hypothetical protein
LDSKHDPFNLRDILARPLGGSVGFIGPNTLMNSNMMNMMAMINPNITSSIMRKFAGNNINGSIKLLPATMNGVDSQIKVNISDGIIAAQKEVGNTTKVVAVNLGVENEYLVYFAWTVDTMPPAISANQAPGLHKVIIDTGNGKVLSSQKMSMMNMMASMGH